MLFYVWQAGLLSLLSPIAIYPVFFALFSGGVLLAHGVPGISRQLRIKSPVFFVWPVLFFGTLSTIVNYQQTDLKSAIKFFVNLFFLMSSVHFFDAHRNVLNAFFKPLRRTFKLFLIVVTLQLMVNLALTGMWRQLFTGVSNSVEAYQIGGSAGFWIGNENKNILGSKALMIALGYAGLLRAGAFGAPRTSELLLAALMVGFVSLATFGRTVVAAALFPLSLYYLDIGRRFMRSRTLTLIAGLFIFIALFGFVSEKLLRVSMIGRSEMDGVTSRLTLWKFYFNNATEFTSMFGNGFLSLRRLFGSNDIEDNFHNVYINMLCDLGIAATAAYVIMIWAFFLAGMTHALLSRLFFFIPFIVITNSQYLGYESDLVYLLSFTYLHYLLTHSVPSATRSIVPAVGDNDMALSATGG